MNELTMPMLVAVAKWFFTSLLGVCLIVIWWGFRSYLRDMREREVRKQDLQDKKDAKIEARDEELQRCISGLERSIWGLRDLFVLRKDYDRDMEILKLDRRKSDRCPSDTCPYEETNPGLLSKTSSAAKRITDLLDASKKAGPL